VKKYVASAVRLNIVLGMLVLQRFQERFQSGFELFTPGLKEIKSLVVINLDSKCAALLIFRG